MLSDLSAMSSLLANSSTSKALKGSLNLQEKLAIWEYRVKGGNTGHLQMSLERRIYRS